VERGFIPPAHEIAIDWSAFLFALEAAFLASVVSSLAPLWQLQRQRRTKL
jgi:ABC-type lipoprotein release transport system permease subunit